MSRILALHGYLQTGSVLSSRLGHLRKANPFKRAGCQFFFIDGPYLVVRDDDGEPHGHILAGGDDARDDDAGGDDAGGDDAGRSWWRFSGGPSPTTGPSQSYKYDGIEASVRLIERAVVEHEIDTILGFSQGAAMAAYFCATQDVSRLGVKRMLAYAGFLPKDPRLAKQMLDRAPISSDAVKTLWVAGTGDAIITAEKSQEAAEIFEAAGFFQHPGGHMIPTTRGELKTVLADFLMAEV